MKLFELQADLKVGRISGREENVERFRRLCRSHSRFCWSALILFFLRNLSNATQHCSLSAPSLCTQKFVRDYFVNGTLPPPDRIAIP